MDNDKILIMEQSLEAVGIKTKQNGEYRPFNDVMYELWKKWHNLMEYDKQKVAKAFVRCFL